MEHLCRDMYMTRGPSFVTRLTITEAEVAKLRPTLLKTLSAESGWTTLVAPYKEEFPDFASLPPPGPYVPDPNPTMIDLCTQEEQMTLDQDVTILDSQGDPGQKQAAAVMEADAPLPACQDEEPIPDSQLDNPLKRPREQAQQTQAPSTGEKPGHAAIAGTGYFGSLADDDDEALPPKPATDDDPELTVSEELTYEEPTKAKAVKVAQDKGKGRGRGRGRGSRKGRGRGRGRGAGGDGSSMEEEEADAMDTQAEAVRGLNMAKATPNPADKTVKGRTTGVRSSKEAAAEANTPPVTPERVWAAPSHPLLQPDVLAVETKEQRIAFARHVEKQGFGVFRLPDRLQPSRFPKLLWALLFLVVQFAEVIFKEGTFDEHGNPTDQGDWLGTDFGTGQRLQMTVTSTNAEGKLSDSSEIAELSTPWAARQWEDMKAKAGGMVDKLNRQVQMAADVASKYLSMLMPFIEEVAGGNIRGGTIIGNDFMHMRKVVTYGTANNFHYSTFPAYRTVEAQVVHMDVQPDPRNDNAEVTAKLDAANADPDAIQRFRDGMVFIIAIQTFFLLLLPDSVSWVMVAERHAEAVFGKNPTAAQVAAYEAELGGMKPLKAHRVKVEAGQCVCIRGYLLHAGDEGQANTMSVRIHFYSSPGFKPGETTYVHGLGKLFCSNVMPTVKPRHGWPLAAEFEVYRDVMVELPPYSPPLVAEHEKHYLKQWDDELPTQLITGLKQIAKAAARKAKVEAEAEKKVQEKAAKRARRLGCSEAILMRNSLQPWHTGSKALAHREQGGLALHSSCRKPGIDSVSIYSHLPPRFLAALRGRRQPVMPMLTLEQRLGPYMTKCRVEGVIGFLGYCEAVQSVEIRLIMDEDTAEAPTYEQLPVGAWLAERLMSNFPNCQVLGIKPFLMQSSELVELLSHPLVVGRIQHLDIQTVNLTARERVVLDAWVEPALGLTSLHATYLGPLPMSLRDRTCNLVELKVTEMYLTDVGNLPQSVSTLLVSALDVVLPEPNMAALNRSVADLSSGRFKHQVIGDLFMGIVRKEGCAAVAALQPLVGRFGKALVQVGEPGNDGKQVVQCDVVQAVLPMLKGVEIRFIYKQQAMEEAPTHAQLPVGAWLAERMMANFPQCLSLRLRGLQCAHPELVELLSHSQFMGRLQQLDIQQLHIQHGSVLDGHYEWVKAYLRLTTLSTVYLGPVPTSLQTCPSRLVKLSVTEMYLTAISLMPESIESLHISHLHVALPEPHQQALTNGVTALSSGRFTTLEIESVSLYFTSLEGGGHASLAALKPLVGRFGPPLTDTAMSTMPMTPAPFMATVPFTPAAEPTVAVSQSQLAALINLLQQAQVRPELLTGSPGMGPAHAQIALNPAKSRHRLEAWTDKCIESGRRASAFCDDYELYCTECGYDMCTSFPLYITGAARNWWYDGMVESYRQSNFTINRPPWSFVRTQFLAYIGDDLIDHAAAARQRLIGTHNRLHMSAGMSLQSYATEFRNHVVRMGVNQLSDVVQVDLFVQGLSYDLRSRVAVNPFSGLAWSHLPAVIAAAQGAERMMMAVAASNARADVVAPMQNVVAAIVPPIGNHAALVVTDNTICYFCQKLAGSSPHGKLRFLMPAKVQGDVRCKVLVDTGATESFVDAHFADQLKAPVRHQDTVRIRVANGHNAVISSQALLTLWLYPAPCEPLWLMKMPDLLCGVDVILGNDWLDSHKAVLDYGARKCTIVSGKNKHELTGEVLAAMPPMHVEVPKLTAAALGQAEADLFLSANEAEALLSQGARAFVALVQSVHAPAVAHGAVLAALQDTDVPSHVAVRLQALLDKYSSVFAEFTELPPDRGVGHSIKLKPNEPIPHSRPYKLSPIEQAELAKRIPEYIAKGWIEPSDSPYSSPLLFVEKNDGTLRMCVDFRALNKITVRDRFPLPLIDDLFDKLQGCTVFSSMDLQSGYHQILIPAEDVPKTAFSTPTGHYQYKVLCFGLTNAPATFQRVMNNIFHDLLGKSVLVYLDDILIMSRSLEEHFMHLEQVLQRLQMHKLFARLSKCSFLRAMLKFLGHIVGKDGIAVDPAKVEAIHSWPVPQTLLALQGFLGPANYVRRFVLGFSMLAAPLTDLVGLKAKDFDWHAWTPETLAAFQALKHAIAQVPMLKLADHTRPFEVCCDASLLGVGAVLLQDDHPVAYMSRKFSAAECNYTTGEQELLALVTACKVWRCYLEGVSFVLVTDHMPLTYLQTQKVLSRRQARWMEYMARFSFEIRYKPGVGNPADPLSRYPVLALTVWLLAITRAQARGVTPKHTAKPDADPVTAMHAPPMPPYADHVMTVPAAHVPPPYDEAADLLPHGDASTSSGSDSDSDAKMTCNTEPPLFHHNTVADQLRAGYEDDPMFRDPAQTAVMKHTDEGLWKMADTDVYVVPNVMALREHILHEVHDAAYSGHSGITKTLQRLRAVFWWSTMREDVRHYVANCDACQHNKAATQKPGGLLQPLSVPGWRWESISMDLIVKLPKSHEGYDSICVFVDRLSKMVHFAPCNESMDAMGFAKLFIKHIFRLHGLPREVITDRGAHFHNLFWEGVCEQLQIKRCLSTAYHPQSDGQTERYNRVLEEMLRHYVGPTQNDWPDHLPCAEFAVNNSWQESIQNTPFFVNFGQSPVTPVLLDLPAGRVPSAQAFTKVWQVSVANARTSMARAQERMARYANARRRPVRYVVGQQVLLSTRNLALKAGAARKLLPRYIGPLLVSALVGPVAVKLVLPACMNRVHPVFHVSLLKPYKGDVPHLPPPLQWLDDRPVYEVEQVLSHRQVRNGRAGAYLLKWKGYGVEHNTWEPRKNMTGCAELLQVYNVAHNLK
ncbi:hypothetical protein QJQ45_020951 [Haematococcus lacustris]|nr:hypothetical protein QJQ45_020951 [Haematococcus lacustris]